MAVLIGHASIDENRRTRGGVAGDQTGKEVCIRNWYANSWTCVLRCRNEGLSEFMALACEKACNNNYIGYDQNQRNTLRNEAKKVNFDINKIKTYCECDCSSLMAVCAECAGIPIPYSYGNAPTTRTMKDAFYKTGFFDILSGSMYTGSSNYLKRGDILVKEGSHTVMVLSNGNATSYVTVPSKYNINSTYTTNSNLYIRSTPFGEKLKHSSLTVDAIYKSHFDEFGCAILNKGVRVTCLEVKELEDSTWIRIPSGWICAINKGKTYIT